MHSQVEEIVCRLGENATCHELDYLIKHEYGNHTIQHVLEFAPDTIANAIFRRFVEYSIHRRANYVVSSSMKKCDAPHLQIYYELFIQHRQAILQAGIIGVEVQRVLDTSLCQIGRQDLASQLLDGVTVTNSRQRHVSGKGGLH